MWYRILPFSFIHHAESLTCFLILILMMFNSNLSRLVSLGHSLLLLQVLVASKVLPELLASTWGCLVISLSRSTSFLRVGHPMSTSMVIKSPSCAGGRVGVFFSKEWTRCVPGDLNFEWRAGNWVSATLMEARPLSSILSSSSTTTLCLHSQIF